MVIYLLLKTGDSDCLKCQVELLNTAIKQSLALPDCFLIVLLFIIVYIAVIDFLAIAIFFSSLNLRLILHKIIQDSEISLEFHFPLAQGWDREQLLLTSEYASKIGSAAVVILHQGQLLMEWGKTAKRINSHSVRKSLLSALYGIAIERKLIHLSSTLEDLEIDDVKPSLTTEEKQATVADLLKSRSGVYHNAAYETFNP